MKTIQIICDYCGAVCTDTNHIAATVPQPVGGSKNYDFCSLTCARDKIVQTIAEQAPKG